MVLALVLTCAVVPACAKATGPGKEWQRTFGGLEAGWIIETSDNGYTVCCGSAILKVLNDGYLSDGGYLEFDPCQAGNARAEQVTSDGGYICVDSKTLVKMDPSCGIEWKTEPVNYDLSFSLVRQTADGGYILAGCTGYSSQGRRSSCTQVIWLAKTDSVGVLEWERTIDPEAVCDLEPASIQQTTDGGYAILAWSLCSIDVRVSFGCRRASLIKTDSDGNVVWLGTFEVEEHLQAFQQTTDGGYILVGSRNSASGDEAWLVKTGSTGDTEWERTFAKGIFNTVCLTSDGGYVMSGDRYTHHAHGVSWGSLPWLMKTDPSGRVEWQKTFGHEREDRSDSVISVQQTSDGGYMVLAERAVGTADYFGGDVWLMKLQGD